MSGFLERMYSRNFTDIYSAIAKIGRLVHIENDSDKTFWAECFEQAGVNDCSFKSYYRDENSRARGKSQYIEHLNNANHSMMFALDSDYDYVAPNHGECNLVHSNQYVIQTYAYSRENIVYNARSVENCLNKMHFFVRQNSEFSLFCDRFSTVILPLLTAFLYGLENQNNSQQILSKSEFKQYLSAQDFHQAYFDESLWGKIETNITTKTAELTASFGESKDDDFSDFVIGLASKGLNENSAYRFISGHFWQESIVEHIVLNWVNSLKASEIERIRAQFDSGEIQMRKKEVDNHFKNNCSFGTLINQPDQYQQDDFYQKILADIKALH